MERQEPLQQASDGPSSGADPEEVPRAGPRVSQQPCHRKRAQSITTDFAYDETRLSWWIPESFIKLWCLADQILFGKMKNYLRWFRTLMLAVSIKDSGSWQHLDHILTPCASISKLSVIISFDRRSCKYQLLKKSVSLQLSLLQSSARSTRYTSSSLSMPRHIYQRPSASPSTSSRTLCVARRRVSSLIPH